MSAAELPRPGRLWSLWDIMEKLRPAIFGKVFQNIAEAQLWLATTGVQVISPDYRQTIKERVVEPAFELCLVAGLSPTVKNACEKMNEALDTSDKTANALKERIQALHERLIKELSGRMLFIVENGRESYWEHEHLFGVQVRNRFTSAAMDIKESGNCWVAGRNNAVAYHLMMAIEVGLRCLAEDRRVDITKYGNSVPIEFAEWGTLIAAIAAKTKELNWVDRHKKTEPQRFYNPLVLELGAFHEGYRNHLMHGRAIAYRDDETFALMGHVKRFLTKLSEKIGEDEITEEVWS